MQKSASKQRWGCALLLTVAGLVSLLPRSSVADGRQGAVAVGENVSETAALVTHDGLSLEAVLAYARAHNPAIQAARQRLRAAQQVPAQVSAYDDPMVMWESWNTPENFRLDRADHNILRLSQKIPFPGKRRLQGVIAAKDAERAEEELRAAELDAVVQVKQAYYELWLVYRNLQVYSRDKELVAQFARIAEQKYAVGLVSQPDVLRAQVELTRLINRVTTETLALGKAQARLNTLLSRPPEAPLGIPQPPPPPRVAYSLSDLETLALKNRPELIGQARTVERAHLVLALARKAYYPDFEVSVSRFVNVGRRDGFGLMVSATIPLAFRGKYDAGVEEAVAHAQSAQHELRRLQDRVRFEVKQALVEAQTALEQLNLFLSTHIPQAEQALAASQIGYQTGRVDFLSLIDSMRAVEQVHLEHFTAAATFEKAWAGLERAVGCELPRQKEAH
ncbi:MAG: TolC family protein [Candidatus Binatia bacterium]|nr:TolC family protein [Candidatus Binatia bacterium]